ncbi:MAG: hypothetical protein K940chlam7_02034 [Chlamydiae bacterium]|nr:hypothetical protein [Chlamydiota bacterium]
MTIDELVTLGETLKQKRKERNLSLKEVENATSIRMNFLKSIEEGECHKLISPVYAQGFVRQYTTFLGVDGEAILREHPELFNRQELQDFSYGIGTLEKRGNPGSGVKWVPNALWVGVFVLVLFGAWYLARFLEVI